MGLRMVPDLQLAPTSWALAFSALAISAYVISSVLAWRRLRHFNGPFSSSFSYLWLIRAEGSGAMGERFSEAETRYGRGPGSTIRVGPNELLTSDPDVIRRTGAARSRYTRSGWYRLISVDPYNPAMINTMDTAAHDRLKAQTAPGYAGKDVPNLESDIDNMVAEMVDKIRTKYANHPRGGRLATAKPMLDLANMAQYFTLDSISKVAFGEEFGLMREERDVFGHIAMLHEVSQITVVIASVPYLRAFMGSAPILSLLGPKPTDKKGFGRLMALVLHSNALAQELRRRTDR